MDIKLPPLEGKYTLWSQAPITGGQAPYATPPFVTQGATVGQPRWQQPSHLSQTPKWGQGVVQNPWGNVPNNPMNNPCYQ